jgi:hypothetical protein
MGGATSARVASPLVKSDTRQDPAPKTRMAPRHRDRRVRGAGYDRFTGRTAARPGDPRPDEPDRNRGHRRGAGLPEPLADRIDRFRPGPKGGRRAGGATHPESQTRRDDRFPRPRARRFDAEAHHDSISEPKAWT